uniref:Uncharacterized protein n=1 Tax=Romanomermis culicivorax TaxID=13658 RepID=A0A915IN64_ROMCU
MQIKETLNNAILAAEQNLRKDEKKHFSYVHKLLFVRRKMSVFLLNWRKSENDANLYLSKLLTCALPDRKKGGKKPTES